MILYNISNYGTQANSTPTSKLLLLLEEKLTGVNCKAAAPPQYSSLQWMWK